MTRRRLHTHGRYLGLVFVGGALGTALREAIGLVMPPVAGWPVGILVANLTGAFVLGVLLESLSRRGPDEGRRRALRLFLGTGVLGGYTTYSALSVDSVTLAASGHLSQALVYAVGSLLAGLVAAAAGIVLAARLPTRGAA